MPLIVEDGSGLSDAESYCSVSEADFYFARRGIVAWAALQEQPKEIALIKGTETINLLFSELFAGKKLKITQALEFPRVVQSRNTSRIYSTAGYLNQLYTYNHNFQIQEVVIGIETELKRATLEFAIRSLDKELLPDIDTKDLGIVSTSKELPGLKKSVTYSQKKQVTLDPVVFRVPLAYMQKYIAIGSEGTVR
jgi:hypothetical protein